MTDTSTVAVSHEAHPTKPAGQPARWKLWLLLSLGVYPIITVVELLAEPVLRYLPLPVQFVLVVPIMVAVMVWVVLPLLHRFFGSWMTR